MDCLEAVTSYATNGKRLMPHAEEWLQNKANVLMKTPFEKLAIIPPGQVKWNLFLDSIDLYSSSLKHPLSFLSLSTALPSAYQKS